MEAIGLQSTLLHPVPLIFVQLTIAAYALAFTAPSSAARYASLPLLVSLAALVTATCLTYTQSIVLTGILANYSASSVLQYVEKGLLSKWSFETHDRALRDVEFPLRKLNTRSTVDNNPTDKSKKGHTATAWERIRFGYLASISFRCSGTPYEVKNVPLYSSTRPSYIPSRAEFFRHKLLVFSLSYLMLDLATLGAQPDLNATLYAPGNIPFFSRLGEMTGERFATRVATTLGFWVSLYCSLQLYTNIIPFLSVACGITSVKACRPTFGSLNKVYTLRGLWGDFWHQFNRQKLSEPANFVTYRVLRLQKGTVSARYVRLFIAFWLSGLIHALTDVAEGYTWQASGSLRYFCTQVLGIMFEDGVQSVYRSLRGLDESPGRQPERWAKVAGYAWVVAFQIWSVPVWVYPALVRNKGEAKDWIIPISFFKMLTA